MKIMAVGDIHIHPDVSSERMTWLGRMLIEEAPDLFLQIGDWNDVQSLSEYDKGTRKAEGQTFEGDCEASKESLDLFLEPLREHNLKQRSRTKKNILTPKKVITLGNHEDRTDRAANKSPSMYGTICTHNFGFQDAGFEVIPFLKPYQVEGFIFQHHFSISNAGTPISGKYAGQRLAEIDGHSRVAGHSHILQISRYGQGTVRWGLNTGYFGPDNQADNDRIFGYLPSGPRENWWNGVLMLDNVEGSNCSPRPIEISDIKKRFA